MKGDLGGGEPEDGLALGASISLPCLKGHADDDPEDHLLDVPLPQLLPADGAFPDVLLGFNHMGRINLVFSMEKSWG